MTPKVIECGACGKRFKDMLKLSAHIRKSHPGKSVSAVVVDKPSG